MTTENAPVTLVERVAQALHDANIGADVLEADRNHDLDAARLIPALRLNGVTLEAASPATGEGLRERVRDALVAEDKPGEPTRGYTCRVCGYFDRTPDMEHYEDCPV